MTCNLLQERKSIQKQGLDVKVLVGQEIEQRHWDVFYDFYLDTIDRCGQGGAHHREDV
jgi:predicted N-acyltransferase